MAQGSTPTPPPLSAPLTRKKTVANKSLLTPSKTLEEYIEGTGIRTDITTIPAARKYLSTNGLILSTGSGTLKNLTTALFELSLSPTLGATRTEALRAIAIIVYEVEQTIDTNKLIEKVSVLMGGPIATLDKKVEALSEFTNNQALALNKAINKVHDHITESTKSLEKTVESAALTSHTVMQNSQSEGQKSYASVTKTGMPTPLTRILA
jgi:hypothetical protein